MLDAPAFIEKGSLPKRVSLRFHAVDQDLRDRADAEAFAKRLVAPAESAIPAMVEMELWLDHTDSRRHERFRIGSALVPRSFIGGLVGLKVGAVIGVLAAITWLSSDAIPLIGLTGAALGAVLGCLAASYWFDRGRPAAPLSPTTQMFSLAFTPTRFIVKTAKAKLRDMSLADVREVRADRLRLHVADTSGASHVLPIGFQNHAELAALAARANELLLEARRHAPHGYRG